MCGRIVLFKYERNNLTPRQQGLVVREWPCHWPVSTVSPFIAQPLQLLFPAQFCLFPSHFTSACAVPERLTSYAQSGSPPSSVSVSNSLRSRHFQGRVRLRFLAVSFTTTARRWHLALNRSLLLECVCVLLVMFVYTLLRTVLLANTILLTKQLT